MKYILAVALLVFSMSTFASGRFGGHASHAVANANARANQHQGQYQGQTQGQQQGQITGVNTSVGGTHFKHNAPGGFAPGAMFPTAPCQATMGAGFSFLLGGGAAAGSRTLDECEKRETLRSGVNLMQNAPTTEAMMEMWDANQHVYCQTEYGSLTPPCLARAPKEAEVVSVVEPKKVSGITDESFEPKLVSLDWPWNWGD